MYFKTDAIVLKSTKSLNNDLFLTLYTRKAGKIDAVANGAKSSKSQLSSCSKPFVFGQFLMNTSNKTMRISSCDLYDSHFKIMNRLDTLAYGNYFLELCNLTTINNVVDEAHYQLIVEIIALLADVSDGVMDFELLRLVYLVKLASITGHRPNLSDHCSNCGIPLNRHLFSVYSGGLLCDHCSQGANDLFKLNETFIKLIHYLEQKDVRIIIKTKIHANYIKPLVDLFESFVMHHNGLKVIHSKSFLKDLGL